MSLTLKLFPLATQEVTGAAGFTHMAVITADMLTQTTANTAQVLTLGTLPDGAIVQKVAARLHVPFEDVSDALYNSTTVILGDAGSTNRYIASSQLNRNGTEITEPVYDNTAYGPLTADTDLIATFGSQATKSLSNIDKGELHIFLQVLDLKLLSTLHGGVTIAK